MLIQSYEERMKRAKDKEALVLGFLVDETWTTVKVLQALMVSKSHVPVQKLLKRLEEKELIRKQQYSIEGKSVTVYGITQHGLLMHQDPDSYEERPVYEPSRVSLSTIPHQIMLQHARIKAEAAGWSGWVRGERLGKGVVKRPDAIAIHPKGHKVAIEVERTAKTSKRYQQIIGEYIQLFLKKEVGRIHYICENGFEKRLEGLFKRINKAYYTIEGSDRKGVIDIEDKHLKIFEFYDINDWPNEED
jgi:hypothetical protein